MRSDIVSVRPWLRLTLGLVLLGALVACSSKKDKVIDPPAELTDFPASLRVQRTWDAGLGGGKDVLRLGLGVSQVDGRAYAAGRDGDVEAFDLNTGKSLWHAKTKAPLSGGTGVGNGLVVVGSSEGAVIALDAASGAERWRVKVNGEVLSAPAVAPQAVIVRTVDGKLRGLAIDSGKQLWEYEQQVPRLSLRGTAIPVVVGNAVICGFDNGKVVSLNIADGSLLWETTVAPSKGRTELERLVDIDSAVKVFDNYVYAVGFQGRVAMLAMDTGQIWWAQDASSYRGLAVDDDHVYISTAEGDVVALKRTEGTEVWRQKGLAHRGLSAPVISNDGVAVADFKGYVHWLDKNTGAFIGRAQAGGERISNPPVANGERVLVINDEGKLTEFKTSPIALASARSRSPAPAVPASDAPGSAPGAPAREVPAEPSGSDAAGATLPTPATPAGADATGEIPPAPASEGPAQASPVAPAEPAAPPQPGPVRTPPSSEEPTDSASPTDPSATPPR
jgi:outer membrane protein assembly factor BamB